MIETRQQFIGWAQAFFSVLVLWGISNVFMGYATQTLGVNKIIFACTTYTSCSLYLLLYAGRGSLAKETLRSTDTWLYGIVMLLNYFITLNLFSVVTATEASLLQRFSVIFSLLGGWVFLLRKPSKPQFLGMGIILVGIVVICAAIEPEKAMTVYILMFLAGVFQALRIFIAELHRPHQKSFALQDVKTRCRVLGYIMFVITLIFVIMTVGIGLLQSSVVPENRNIFLVQPQDFFHAPSILSGMVMGVLIYTPIRYLEFSSTQVIKTENFLTVTAFSFVSTLFWEWVTLPITDLSLKTLSTTDVLAGFAITIGALIMALSKIRSIGKSDTNLEKYVYVDTQNLNHVDDCREIIAVTLEHTGGDVEKAAQKLHIPKDVIYAYLNDHDKIIAFTPKTFEDVTRHYRKQVALADSLTGLSNRPAFMTALKKAVTEAETFSILYIDLDKFKPVNDSYGHETGDKILQSVADRLRQAYGPENTIARMGGDEFCLILPHAGHTQASIEARRLEEIIAQPFSIHGVATPIVIGASVGRATYPTDGTAPEDLLSKADAGMYRAKKSGKHP